MNEPSLSFQPSIAIGLSVSSFIALMMPFILAVAVHRRTGVSFKYFGLGAAIFFVSQIVLRVPWQLALGRIVEDAVKGRTGLLLAWIGFSALTAGLFEEVGRWVGYRYLVKRERSWRVGLMYGLGHGGTESILLVGLSLVGLLAFYVFLTHGMRIGIPEPQLDPIRAQLAQLTPTSSVVGGVERLFALALHVAWSLLVLQAFVRGHKRWLLYAIAFHFLADFSAATAAKFTRPIVAQAVVAPFALVSLLVINAFRDSSKSTD